MDTYIPSILALIILLICSAFCSANETALTGANKIRLKNQMESEDKKAGLAYELIENYDSALTTLLILNNVVNILSASIATILFTKILGSNGVGVATIVMTIMVVIFGEVLPKSLAKINSEKLLKKSAKTLNFLIFLMKPFVFLLSLIKKCFTKNNIEEYPTVTEEELLFIIDEIEEEGVLEEDQAELVQNAIEFNDIFATEIITPRVDITAVSTKETIDKVKDLFLCYNYSRMPVYDESIDHIIGFVNQKELFSKLLQQEKFEWQDLVKPCLYVPPKKRIIEIMQLLQKEKIHMAVVTDEYGGTLGIVTLEDILEQLVGEIWDEHDEVIQELKQEKDNSYIAMGTIQMSEIYELVNNNKFNKENINLSSYILEKLSKIPDVDDIFSDEYFSYKILEMSDNRIIKTKISILAKKES